MPPEARFRPVELLRVLIEHQVDFVVIGGFAALLHGSALPTIDLDITPGSTRQNLERLASALRELDARVHVPGQAEGLRFDCSAATIARARTWNLVTSCGPLDISMEPDGTHGYEDLRRGRVRIELDTLPVPVACLADVVRSKEAAGRDKDRLALPLLRKLLTRLDEPER
jgi:hypothetical protein